MPGSTKALPDPYRVDGCRLKASGRSTDPSDWLALTDELERSIAAAVRSGAHVVTVLGAHGVSRGTYYQWLAIGRGERTTWWDGCPIDDQVRQRCWHLAVAVAEAHVDRARSQLDHLRILRVPHSDAAPLRTSRGKP